MSVHLLHDGQAEESESGDELRGDHQADQHADAAHPNRCRMIQAGSEEKKMTAGVRAQPTDPRDQQFVGIYDCV